MASASSNHIISGPKIYAKAVTKMVSRTSNLVAVALGAGLALAALCKLIYDLFNGYPIVPNLFVDLGFMPSQLVFEALQFFCLALTAFIVGSALLKAISGMPGKIAFAIALPWSVLCVWGIASALLGEDAKVLLELARSSYLLGAAPPLMTAAVPFGVWLAYRVSPQKTNFKVR